MENETILNETEMNENPAPEAEEKSGIREDFAERYQAAQKLARVLWNGWRATCARATATPISAQRPPSATTSTATQTKPTRSTPSCLKRPTAALSAR